MYRITGYVEDINGSRTTKERVEYIPCKKIKRRVNIIIVNGRIPHRRSEENLSM